MAISSEEVVKSILFLIIADEGAKARFLERARAAEATTLGNHVVLPILIRYQFVHFFHVPACCSPTIVHLFPRLLPHSTGIHRRPGIIVRSQVIHHAHVKLHVLDSLKRVDRLVPHRDAVLVHQIVHLDLAVSYRADRRD